MSQTLFVFLIRVNILAFASGLRNHDQRIPPGIWIPLPGLPVVAPTPPPVQPTAAPPTIVPPIVGCLTSCCRQECPVGDVCLYTGGITGIKCGTDQLDPNQTNPTECINKADPNCGGCMAGVHCKLTTPPAQANCIVGNTICPARE